MRRSSGSVPALLALSFVLPLAPGRGARAVAAEPAPPAARAGDPRDRLLEGRALRIAHNTAARHVSPEGLLAYIHRPEATPEQLSADAVKKADTGIWTGCYAAATACRYAVTRDPSALAEARRVAHGLHLLSAATGDDGLVSRGVGRPIPGEDAGKDLRPSPLGNGLYYRAHPSRDTLTGIVLGWTLLARFVDDPEVKALAARHLGAIARRLFDGKMSVRDADGKTTSEGSLSADVGGVFDNGMHAVIGCSVVLAGLRHGGGDDLKDAFRQLEKRGWVDAIDTQWLFVPSVASADNMNMVSMACLVVALEHEGKPRRQAMSALRDVRRKTRGWQNGAYLACALLAGQLVDRDESIEELRETLLRMPAEEVPWVGARRRRSGRLVPIEDRPVGEWAWKEDSYRLEEGREDARPDTTRTFTRADFLFAYWLARASGALNP